MANIKLFKLILYDKIFLFLVIMSGTEHCVKEAMPMAESASGFELDNRIFFRLFQAANLMHKQGTRALAEQRTTTQEWSILGALSRREIREAQGMSVGDLCDYLMVTRQNLAGTLKRLESAGLIERTADEVDGRARRLQLTRDGERRWRQLQPLIARRRSAHAAVLRQFRQRLAAFGARVQLDCVDDFRVPRAAAKVHVERLGDLVSRWRRVLANDVMRA